MEYNPNEKVIKQLVETLEKRRQSHLEDGMWTKRLYWLLSGILILLLLASLVYEVVVSFFFIAILGTRLFIQFKKLDAYAEKYNTFYKETFVKRFVQFFYPEITYQPGKFSTSNNIQASFLYDSLDFKDGLSCEDGFRGKTAEGFDFTMMEIQHELRQKVRREFFVSIKLPDKEYYPVFVAPRPMMESILEAYHEEGRSLKESSNLYEYPMIPQSGFDPSFEEKYVVYSPRKEDASALLTTSFLASIQKLEKQWTETIRFSLVEDTLHIGFSSPYNFFELDIERTVLTSTVGQELFNQLSIYLTTVEALSIGLKESKLPVTERTPLPKNIDLPSQNWDDSAYDHFIDN